jgi:hypothetical protein
MERVRDGRNECGIPRARRLLTSAAVLAATVLLAACFTIKRQAKPLVPELAKPRATPTPAPFTPPAGVEVIAEASGNIVMVTVINHTDKPVLVGSKMFAVYAEGKFYPGDGKNVASRFPVKTLRREEGASGAFQFRDLASVEGQKLVLRSPDAEQQVVTVKRYEPRAPNYQVTERPLRRGESRRLEREQDALRQALLGEMQKNQKAK